MHKNPVACQNAKKEVGIIMGKTRWARWGLCALACAVLFLAWLHNPVKNAGEQTPPPTPTVIPQPGPLSGAVICLDPGHGGYDGGAYGRDSGTPEKALNLDVALRLRDLLRDQGAEVILTRETDTALADEGAERKRRDLKYRVDQAAEANIFVSVHMNEYRGRSESGPQVFYRKGQDASRLLAGVLQDAMNRDLAPARPRTANTGDYYVLRNLSIPAVLVECGFLSNAAEEAKLLTPEYRQQVAQAICAGLAEYWQLGRQNGVD